MIQTTRCFLVGLILLMPCLSTFGKKPRDEMPDIEKLQGTWLADLEPGLQNRLVLDGSRLLLVNINKQRETVIWDGHFAINELANPKEMDWTPLRRNNRNPPANLAIYHLDGDLLLIVGNTQGARPTAFYSGGGAYRPKTIIYRRQKDKDDRKSRAAASTESK
jgi:uncharacterized protein (TIGR03067 family)